MTTGLVFYLNLNGILCKELILAICTTGVGLGGVRMLFSVRAADQAAEISYGFSLDLRLAKLVPVKYCFYQKRILKLFSVGCKYYETSDVVGC